MRLKELCLRDKKIFDEFLTKDRQELSVYAFENIYIWKGLFDIRWLIIKDSLCVFFKDRSGCFLYLAPLSENKNPEVIKEVFGIMDEFNKNKEISRIENIPEWDTPFYKNLGYVIQNKFCEYLCKRSDLTDLAGDRFKAKRAPFNYFIKHYASEYIPFSSEHKDECLRLYDSWAKERKSLNPEHIYQYMLEDSRISLKNALEDYSSLNLIGRIARINKEIKAFTFGFKLNQDTFCILYEVADLSIKGLSQFIFRRFCRELEGYKYINIMDDSGLENLKRVKLSYKPVKLIPSYIVKRKNESSFPKKYY